MDLNGLASGGVSQIVFNTNEPPAIIRPVFQEGSTLPYLGFNYPFRIVNGQNEINSNEKVKLVNGEFRIFSRSSRPSRKHMRCLYEEWLLEKAKYTFEQKTKAAGIQIDIYLSR